MTPKTKGLGRFCVDIDNRKRGAVKRGGQTSPHLNLKSF